MLAEPVPPTHLVFAGDTVDGRRPFRGRRARIGI
jgi:hypothetical protein